MTDDEDTIRPGRACVRLIEAAQALLKAATDKHDRIILEGARVLAVRPWRQLVRDSDPAVTAEIMVASGPALGTMRDVSKN